MGATLPIADLFAVRSAEFPAYAAARKVGDSFIADLVANEVNHAVSLIEPDFVQTLGLTQAEAQVQKLFD